MTVSQRLATFAADLRYEDLPTGMIEHIKVCLLDTLGCGLFGSTLPWTRIVAETVAADAGPAPVWGHTARVPAPHAALVNGTAVHAFELDDLHPRSILHPGSVVVPAALALAATTGPVSGRRLLTAIVAGYEVGARAGSALGAAHLLAGWHPTGTHGTLAAAAAAGSVLGLDGDRLAHALGIAGSHSSGLMAAQYGAMVKRLNAGHAAQSGVLAAQLAARGFTGIAELFEADYGGYLTTFAPRADLDVITDGLGERWEVERVGFKPYSTNGSCQPSIDALRHLRAETGLRASDVAEVRIRCSTATVKHVGWPYRPDSVTTAQMNLPYITAVVLTDGEAFVDQFAPDRIADPALVELAGRVRVEADPEIDARGDAGRHATRLEVRLHDGRVLRAERDFAHGSARDPMTREEVEAKYERLAGKALPAAAVRELAEAVAALDDADDVTGLTDLLAGDLRNRAAR